MVERTCQVCNKTFRTWSCLVKKGFGKYCSHKCSIPNKGGSFVRGHVPWNKGTQGVMKAWNKGIPNTWYNPKGLEVGRGLFKGKHQPKISGANHWNWQGGKTKPRDRRTKLLEYKLWRKAVYERDNYTCINCGDNTSGKLEADHIKPWAVFPELRYAIDNGQTLCKKCHFEKTKVDSAMYFNKKYHEVN